MLSQVLNWNWNCLHFGINWSENIKFHHQVTAIVRIQFCESNSTWKLFPCFNWMQHIHLFTKQFQWSKILGTYGMYCSLEVILHDPVQVDVRTLSWPHSGRHIFFGWSLFFFFFLLSFGSWADWCSEQIWNMFSSSTCHIWSICFIAVAV